MDKKNIISNSGGQAMLEFTIVFPVLISIIVGIIQIALVVNAVSLGNYAAFVAARSYAVHRCSRLAKRAAAIVYAPVSVKIPGEIISGVPSLVLGNLAPFLTGIPGLNLVERYQIAYKRTTVSPAKRMIFRGGLFGGGVEVVEMTVEHNFPLWIFGIGWLLEPLAPQYFVKINGWPYLKIETKCAMGMEIRTRGNVFFY